MQLLDIYDNEFESKKSVLSKQWIHNDLNEYNLLVEDRHLVGFIDLTDIVYSYRVVDIGICLYYLCTLVSPEQYPEVITDFLFGYRSVSQLADTEVELIYPLICKRLVMSIAISEYQYNNLEPDNDYLVVTARAAVPFLNYLCSIKGKSCIRSTLKSIIMTK